MKRREGSTLRRTRIAVIAVAATTVVGATHLVSAAHPATTPPDGTETSGADGTETSGADGANHTAADIAVADLSLDRSLKIGLLMAIPGEDDNAVPNGADAAAMAIDEINEAGGLGGHPIEYFRVPWSISDPASARQSFLDALAEEPDILYGAFSGTGVDAVVTSGLLDEAAIPFVTYLTPTNNQASDNGSQWLFQFRSSTTAQAAAGTRYAIETLGASEIGVVYVDAEYGQLGLEGIETALDEAGLEPFAEQSHDATATDLTSTVLAMQGADAVVSWDYPNPMGVMMNQFLQNGVADVPIIAGSSFVTVVNNNLADPEAIALNPDSVGIAGCVATTNSPNEPAATFATAFSEQYGYLADETATTSYDAVYLMADVAVTAGSIEPDAMREALATETLHGTGACQPEYRANERGDLSHTATLLGVGEDGTLEDRGIVELS